MKISNPIRRVAWVFALSACATTLAFAKDSGFYVGANVGVSKYDLKEDEFRIFPIVTTTQTEDSDLSFALLGGYRFNPYIGVEVSLGTYGSLKVQETGFVTTTPSLGGLADMKVGVEGTTLAVIGSLPVGKFEFFGKVGAIYAQTKADLRLASLFGTLPNTGVGSVESKTTEALYGVGVGYTIGEDFFLKLEWMRIPKLGDADDLPIEEIDLDNISLGFQFRF